MRRFVFGILWFMAFSYGTSIVGAWVAERVTARDDSHEARAEARDAFGRRFGPYIFFGSIILAAAGTWTGRLPGTARKNGTTDGNRDGEEP